MKGYQAVIAKDREGLYVVLSNYRSSNKSRLYQGFGRTVEEARDCEVDLFKIIAPKARELGLEFPKPLRTVDSMNAVFRREINQVRDGDYLFKITTDKTVVVPREESKLPHSVSIKFYRVEDVDSLTTSSPTPKILTATC